MINPAFEYIDLIESLVEKIRLRGLVTSIIETGVNSGLYLLSLSDYHGVEINKFVNLGVVGLEEGKIVEIPMAGQMIVSGESGVDVSSVTKYIRLDPFFYADRGTKIIEAIISKNNSYFKNKMFPSVELVLDKNNFDDSVKNYSVWETMRIVLCEKTDQTETAQEKDIDTFKPVLRPNYSRLKYQIENSKKIISKDATFDRSEYFGEIYNAKKDAYAKPFYVDAIVMQVSGLKLINNIDNCETIKDF